VAYVIKLVGCWHKQPTVHLQNKWEWMSLATTSIHLLSANLLIPMLHLCTLSLPPCAWILPPLSTWPRPLVRTLFQHCWPIPLVCATLKACQLTLHPLHAARHKSGNYLDPCLVQSVSYHAKITPFQVHFLFSILYSQTSLNPYLR